MEPVIGARVAVHGHCGTIKYIGSVDSTQGTWLGIEWDDPTRGKHDGVHNGRLYFTCRVPGSGSFIRPTASGLTYGRTFVEALVSKYIDEPHNLGGSAKETVVLGSSKGLIEVEAVGLDKVRARLANLDRLVYVSLDDEGVSGAGEKGEIQQRCPNTRNLDLSKNLLPSWDVVVLILEQLQYLETLILNQNRFLHLDSIEGPGLRTVKELQLNDTLMDWAEVSSLGPLFPTLVHLQLGHNRMTALSKWSFGSNSHAFQDLQHLNLEGNFLSDWMSTIEALACLSNLQRLILSGNRFSSIPVPHHLSGYLPTVRHLSVAQNQLAEWPSVDALNQWLPQVTSLSIVDNPLMSGDDRKYSRSLIIAKLASLLTLNGTSITAAERVDAERFYLSYIEKTDRGSERRQRHPRWAELSALHGAAEPSVAQEGQEDLLKSHLIQLFVLQLPSAPTIETPLPSASSLPTIRILPSMTVRTLRVKVLKMLRLGVKTAAKLYSVSRGQYGNVVEELDRDDGVDRWGLENGGMVAVVVESA